MGKEVDGGEGNSVVIRFYGRDVIYRASRDSSTKIYKPR
jgi:hypothetical protein